MANIPNIPNIPEGTIPPSIPNDNPNVPNIPGGAPNVPNIPNGVPNVPDIPTEMSTSPINIPSKEKPDATKWILLTGDFQKDGAIISWFEKKDLENNCTSIEECTLSSLDKKIKEMKAGSSETYIAILPPDKSEFIYLYKGYKRNDLYYYRSSEEYRSGCTYRKTDVSIDELKEAAINYFTKSQLPDLEESELIDERLDDSKICEIRKEWKDKFPTEFIDKVLQNVYLFYSPEETESRIFGFIKKMQTKDDLDFGRVERMANKEMKALLLEDIVLSHSQESVVTEIVQDIVQILTNAHNKKEEQKRKESDSPRNRIREERDEAYFHRHDSPEDMAKYQKLDKEYNDFINSIEEERKRQKEAKQAEEEAAKKAEAAKAKAKTEARKAEAALRQKQKKAEEKAKKEKSRKRFRLGCLGIILVIILFSWISSSIKSCQRESEDQEQIINTDEEIESSDLDIESISADEGVEAMLENRFDYVCQYGNYFEIKKNEKYGIADLKGNVKIAPKYDYIGSADEDLGIVEVKQDDKYGMVSLKTLTEIVKPKYDYIGSVSEESKTIEVRTNGKYGLLSSDNLSEIVEPTYDYIGSYNEKTGLYEVRKNSKYGLFSPKLKKEVASCVFSYISYEGGLYQVRKDGKSGYLNSDGSVLKPLQ